MFFFYVFFFFLIHLATAMETDTGISSLSINMTPWWFSKWIFFFLDIFWVCLYALFCFVYYSFFVCFCILRKTNTVLAQNEFLNKGQRKGEATRGTSVVGLSFVVLSAVLVCSSGRHDTKLY